MARRKASAAEPLQRLFLPTFAVCQVEVVLASMVPFIFGLTAILHPCAVWVSDKAPSWIGGVGTASSAGMMIAGIMKDAHPKVS